MQHTCWCTLLLALGPVQILPRNSSVLARHGVIVENNAIMRELFRQSFSKALLNPDFHHLCCTPLQVLCYLIQSKENQLQTDNKERFTIPILYLVQVNSKHTNTAWSCTQVPFFHGQPLHSITGLMSYWPCLNMQKKPAREPQFQCSLPALHWGHQTIC